jgi:hypothetical protein
MIGGRGPGNRFLQGLARISEIRNPKQIQKDGISKMEKEELGNFFAACEQFGLFQCRGAALVVFSVFIASSAVQ